jgi:D-alanine-D-alanine ligase
MAESYIDGRELSVTVLGNIPNLLVLPAKEILFSQKFGSIPHIVTYDSKWTEDSKDYQGSLGLACPAILDSQEKSALDRVVRQAVAALGVRDYARFDIRLKNRIPYIIDYNANPALGYDAASRIPAEISGISYPGLLSAIVRSACLRSR